MQIQPGQGDCPRYGQTVAINYECFLPSNELVDSTYIRKTKLKFQVCCHQTIPGVDEVVQNMKVGEIVKVKISYKKAF
uniref:peptidylprolyl isomerase n=1 Tax=Trepomonas sp. PC1 TaxID=1076344 RepID=A0A146KJL9_9EUKA|eukprot:JAP95656.1 Peptidyl-prolyl cis-trans isomerase [Trepomonas sp. PC1]